MERIADPGRANATGNPEPSATAIVNIRLIKIKVPKH